MAETGTDPRLIRLHPSDNVCVLAGTIRAGDTYLVEGARVTSPITVGLGHKIASQAIASGDKVRKYGAPIGSATRAIAAGAHVHLHNMKSDYTPTYALDAAKVRAGVTEDAT